MYLHAEQGLCTPGPTPEAEWGGKEVVTATEREAPASRRTRLANVSPRRAGALRSGANARSRVGRKGSRDRNGARSSRFAADTVGECISTQSRSSALRGQRPKPSGAERKS